MKQVILLMILMLFSLPSFTQVKIKLRKIETPQQVKKNPSVNNPKTTSPKQPTAPNNQLSYEDNIALLRVDKQIESNNFQDAINLLETISLSGKKNEQYLLRFALCNEKMNKLDVAIASYKQLYFKTNNTEYLNKIAELEDLKLVVQKNQKVIDELKDSFVLISGGTFTMGSPSSEADRDSDETQHQVSLSSFKMSKYEITFAQYDVFCEQTGRQKPSDEGWGRGNRPVINVSWDDANAFAQWMGCRLPTEAEWEYACRAGTTTPYNTGYSLSSANFNKINNKTMPVGSYPSNTWGLHDMHGNVWEWCSDFYGGTTEYASNRVYRGGGWNSGAGNCRSAYRDHYAPSGRLNYLGFRLVAP